MEKERKEQCYSVLDLLPQWREKFAQSGEYAVEKEDVRSLLQQMCGCIYCDSRPVCREGIYRILHSWYVPRNANDATMYVRRHKMWQVFTEYVDELLNYLIR